MINFKPEDNSGFIEWVAEHDGKVFPLFPDTNPFSEVKAFINPSVLAYHGRLLVNLRGINYVFFNSQQFPYYDQPTVYFTKDDCLTTENFICTFDFDRGELSPLNKVDTSAFDKKALWKFHGLEDARLVDWNNRLFLSGVRRDVDDKGTGRMELSEIEEKEDCFREISRNRICIPEGENTYCEKNWMPFDDKPFTWMRNSSVNSVAFWNEKDNVTTERVSIPKCDLKTDNQLRGSSQLVHYGKSYYGIVHECDFQLLDKNTNARTGKYYHRFIETDEDFVIRSVSKPFSFDFQFNIEFCCGMAIYKDKCFITFSENDAFSYLIEIDADELFG